MRKIPVLIGLLMLVTLSVRLFFAFHVPTLSGDAYFTLRQVEHIRDTGMPIIDDPLSYGGRRYLLQPLWYYLLALPSLAIPPIAALKIMPNLCMVLLIPLCYRLCRKLTGNAQAALGAALAAWVPATFAVSLNDASPVALALPLSLLLLDSFLELDTRWGRWKYGIALVLLGLTHSVLLLLAVTLIAYALIRRAEGFSIRRSEWEALFCTAVFALWVHLIFFKQELLRYGASAVWGAIPRAVLTNYFSDIGMLQAIGAIGSLPLLYGIYAMLNTAFGHSSNREHHLLLGLLLCTGSALWLKLIPLRLGLPLLGLGLSISFAHFLEMLQSYTARLHVQWIRALVVVAIGVALVFSEVFPAVLAARGELNAALPAEDVAAMDWLRRNTPSDAIILANVYEGNAIAAIGKRKTIADTHFQFAPDAERRYADVRLLFTTPLRDDAVAMLQRYDVSYAYLSPRTRKQYGQGLLFSDTCFREVYSQEVAIYAFICT